MKSIRILFPSNICRRKYLYQISYVCFCLILFSLPVHAQKTLNTALAIAQTTFDPVSIRLSPGFSISGKFFHAYIGSGASTISSASYSAPTPSNDRNYITVTAYNKATTSGVVPSRGDKVVSIQYFDGLGRLMQTIERQASPAGSDMVVPVKYDGFGRETKKYLPYTAISADGSYKTDDYNDVLTFYSGSGYAGNYCHDPFPFKETVFEPSPLNRVQKIYNEGLAWRSTDKAVRFVYRTNNASEVLDWQIENSNTCSNS